MIAAKTFASSGAEFLTPAQGLELGLTLAAFVAIVFFVLLFVFAELTGWRKLARTYALQGPFPLERYRGDGVVVGHSGWSAPPLIICISDTELVLVPLRPFRPIFPAVAIAWNEIVTSDVKKYQFFTIYRLTLAHGGTLRHRMVVGILSTPAIASIQAHLALRTLASTAS